MQLSLLLHCPYPLLYQLFGLDLKKEQQVQLSQRKCHSISLTISHSLSNWGGSAAGFLLGLAIRHESQIPLLMYLHAGIASLTAIAIILYFPEKPPTPPAASSELASNSSSKKSTKELLEDVKEALSNWSFVIVMMVAGMSTGMLGMWTTLFDVLLMRMGYSQV